MVWLQVICPWRVLQKSWFWPSKRLFAALLILVFGTTGCTASVQRPQPTPAAEAVSAAEDALARGLPLRALAALVASEIVLPENDDEGQAGSKANIEGQRELTTGSDASDASMSHTMSQGVRSYGHTLIEVATAQAQAVVAAWRRNVGRILKRGKFAEAKRRWMYLKNELVDAPALWASVADFDAELARAIQSRTERLNAWVARLDKDIAAGRRKDATKTLSRLVVAHAELDPLAGLAREFQWMGMEAWLNTDPAEVVASRTRARRRSQQRRQRERDADTVDVALDADADEDLELPDNEKAAEMGALLVEAKRARRKKMFGDAIVLYRKILAESPENAEATAALRALEPEKKRLIKTYLDNAESFFLRQDLGRAVPFFRRVLALDPTNVRARDGIEMYEKLRRIQDEAIAP